MLEAGEMRSAEDAELLASDAGQERIAAAIVAALTDTLVTQDP
jgi:N-acetylmuramoyl-L-alanine amidase